jgi:hypothetical protein
LQQEFVALKLYLNDKNISFLLVTLAPWAMIQQKSFKAPLKNILKTIRKRNQKFVFMLAKDTSIYWLPWLLGQCNSKNHLRHD